MEVRSVGVVSGTAVEWNRDDRATSGSVPVPDSQVRDQGHGLERGHRAPFDVSEAGEATERKGLILR